MRFAPVCGGWFLQIFTPIINGLIRSTHLGIQVCLCPVPGAAVGQESGRVRPRFPWTYHVGESALPHSFIQQTCPRAPPRPQALRQVLRMQTGPLISQSHPSTKSSRINKKRETNRERSANRVRSTRRRDGQVSRGASNVNRAERAGGCQGRGGPSGRWMRGVLPLVWGWGTCASCKLHWIMNGGDRDDMMCWAQETRAVV